MTSTPSIKIDSWRWEKVETQTQSFRADSMAATKYVSNVQETVTAYFALEGVEPTAPSKRQPNRRVALKTLMCVFESVNGGAWKLRWGTKVIAFNVKKDGSEGARVDIQSYDLAPEIKALFEKDGHDRSDAVDWVRAEYPR